MTKRKKLYYMDLTAVECGTHLSRLEQLTHERMMTSRDWDALIFWLDLEAALASVTDKQRICFVLKYIEGFTEKEIAQNFKLAQSTVSRHLSRGRKNIRNFLSDGYKTP